MAAARVFRSSSWMDVPTSISTCPGLAEKSTKGCHIVSESCSSAVSERLLWRRTRRSPLCGNRVRAASCPSSRMMTTATVKCFSNRDVSSCKTSPGWPRWSTWRPFEITSPPSGSTRASSTLNVPPISSSTTAFRWTLARSRHYWQSRERRRRSSFLSCSKNNNWPNLRIKL